MFRHFVPSRELHSLATLVRLSLVDLPSANSMKCCSPPASLEKQIPKIRPLTGRTMRKVDGLFLRKLCYYSFGDLPLYVVIPVIFDLSSLSIQVNPRFYKAEVITYCLKNISHPCNEKVNLYERFANDYLTVTKKYKKP